MLTSAYPLAFGTDSVSELKIYHSSPNYCLYSLTISLPRQTWEGHKKSKVWSKAAANYLSAFQTDVGSDNSCSFTLNFMITINAKGNQCLPGLTLNYCLIKCKSRSEWSKNENFVAISGLIQVSASLELSSVFHLNVPSSQRSNFPAVLPRALQLGLSRAPRPEWRNCDFLSTFILWDIVWTPCIISYSELYIIRMYLSCSLHEPSPHGRHSASFTPVSTICSILL